MRHIMVPCVYVKRCARRKMVSLVKVGNKTNLADLSTKYFPKERFEQLCGEAGEVDGERGMHCMMSMRSVPAPRR